MEVIRKNYLLEKYKDILGEDLPKFDEALNEASNYSFSKLLDLDIEFNGNPTSKRNLPKFKEMLFEAAKAQPDEHAEKPHNYHKDVYKTIKFYDTYKKEVSKPNMENFKSAVYYVPDGAYKYAEEVELLDKNKLKRRLYNVGALFGAGSFYLGNKKRGIMQSVLTCLLLAAVVLACLTQIIALIAVVSVAVVLALAFRWGAEIDVCKYYINVINGQRIIDALRQYREVCKSE